MNEFMELLKQYRHLLPKQIIKTLRGQAISGNIEGAIKGLEKSLHNNLSKRDTFVNAHRSTRHMVRQHNVEYKDQFAIYLNKY